MPRRITLYDVKQENQAVSAELTQAFQRVVASGRFVLGPELAAFEKELAEYLGVAHAVGVKSGTDALILGLEALGIGPGDEVITTPFTFRATVEAISRVGATPVFADIEPETLCLSLESCAKVLTSRTKAVILVHIFGHCTDIDQFRRFCQEHNLAIIEDAAQAIGASWRGRRLGSLGNVGIFSFYPTKNLSALGDGGAVVTSDPLVAERLNQFRLTAHSPLLSASSLRLDELQAAFLRSKLTRLEQELERRRELARRYDTALSGMVRLVRGAAGCLSNHHQYAILTEQRDGLRKSLGALGIETGVYYPKPVYQEWPIGERRGWHSVNRLPVAERACQEVLCLPIRPSLTDDEQATIINAIESFFFRK
ncbi:MAG: DegT/DnrJ/EryC1/StrS family aminotransferase [candidate division WOR-3 bacterium]